ncbi:MAG: protein kinase [Hormoscilla sp.]
MNAMEGQRLAGRYDIIKPLTAGSFGRTYLAQDRRRIGNSQCVVKQLQPQTRDREMFQTARRLFDREAEALYRLGNHPQIPGLWDRFEENQQFYLVSEFIAGNLLSQEIPPGKQLRESDVLVLLHDILEVLAFVHQQNAIHCNLKPQNIIRQPDGKLVLIDFGVVKLLSSNAGSMRNLTIGTPGYMPREQTLGKPRLSSDVYAVGMMGIFALTGIEPDRLPEDSETGEVSWRQQVQVNSQLADVLDKMVRYDFRQRYPSATEALQALQDPGLMSSYQDLSRENESLERLYDVLFGTAADTNNLPPQKFQSYSQVNAAVDKLIKLQDRNYLAWYFQGDVLLKMKRYAEAIAHYCKAIEIEPTALGAWRTRVQKLQELQRPQDAIDLCCRVITALKRQVAASPPSQDRARNRLHQSWYKLGNSLRELHCYEQAAVAYSQALEIKPDDYNCCYLRGEMLEQLQGQ